MCVKDINDTHAFEAFIMHWCGRISVLVTRDKTYFCLKELLKRFCYGAFCVSPIQLTWEVQELKPLRRLLVDQVLIVPSFI